MQSDDVKNVSRRQYANTLHAAEQPRIVHHVDDVFRQKVTQVYRQYIPANGAVLDLMSSWVSHLPKDVSYSLVVGHGMNAQEVNICNLSLSFFMLCSHSCVSSDPKATCLPFSIFAVYGSCTMVNLTARFVAKDLNGTQH